MLGNFREAKLSPQTILVPVGWAAEYSGGGEHIPLEDGLSGLPPLQSIDDPAVWLPVAHLCGCMWLFAAVCSCVQPISNDDPPTPADVVAFRGVEHISLSVYLCHPRSQMMRAVLCILICIRFKN